MKGIIVYEKGDAEYNRSFIDYLISEGEKVGVELELKLYEKFTFGIKDNQCFVEYEGQPLEKADVVLYRCRKYLLSRQLENMGYWVVNSSKVCEICNDKALTYQYVSQLEIDMVPSMFVENEFAESLLRNQSSDMVVKAVSGHGGSQVCLVKPDDEETLQEALRLMRGERVVIQPLMKGRGQDLRVYVVGGKIVAAVLRTAKSGFKSNFSLGGEVRLYELTKEETEVVNNIIGILSLDYAGIDFIIGEDGRLLFNEIEDVVGARMLYQCSDIDIVPIYLEYVKQYCNNITDNNK